MGRHKLMVSTGEIGRLVEKCPRNVKAAAGHSATQSQIGRARWFMPSFGHGFSPVGLVCMPTVLNIIILMPRSCTTLHIRLGCRKVNKGPNPKKLLRWINALWPSGTSWLDFWADRAVESPRELPSSASIDVNNIWSRSKPAIRARAAGPRRQRSRKSVDWFQMMD